MNDEVMQENTDPYAAQRTIIKIRREREEAKGITYQGVNFTLDTAPLKDFIERGQQGTLRGTDGAIEATVTDAQIILDAVITRKADLVGREAELLVLLEQDTNPDPTYPQAPEVTADIERTEKAMETVAKNRATQLAQRKAADELLDTLPDEDVETLTYLYPRWDGAGVAYETDHKVRHEGILYKVLQNHTSQPDWTPDTATSLYARFRDPAQGPQPWVQPTGAQDAYATGERVTHDNPNDAGNIWIYESAIDANTTEPGRDGEFDRYWTPISVVA